MKAAVRFEVETERMNRKLERAVHKLGISFQQAVTEASVFFCQSVVKQTPITPHKKRMIEDFPRGWEDRQRKPSGYDVLWSRVIGDKRQRGRWQYGPSRKTEASRHAKITYRGLGRAGWWAASPRPGGKPSGVTDAAAGMAGRLSDLSEGKDLIRPWIVMTNKVSSIKRGTDAKLGMGFALGKAANRLNGYVNSKLKSELRESWR